MYTLLSLSFRLSLFYNDYETRHTTYINHARWHRCLRSDDPRVEGYTCYLIFLSFFFFKKIQFSFLV